MRPLRITPAAASVAEGDPLAVVAEVAGDPSGAEEARVIPAAAAAGIKRTRAP